MDIDDRASSGLLEDMAALEHDWLTYARHDDGQAALSRERTAQAVTPREARAHARTQTVRAGAEAAAAHRAAHMAKLRAQRLAQSAEARSQVSQVKSGRHG